MGSYKAEWNSLRNREAVHWCVFLGGFAAMVAVSVADLLPSYVPGYVPFVALLIAVNVAGGRVNLFPCPHCKKPFFKANAWSVNSWLQECPHCGLAKWDGDDGTLKAPPR